MMNGLEGHECIRLAIQHIVAPVLLAAGATEDRIKTGALESTIMDGTHHFGADGMVVRHVAAQLRLTNTLMKAHNRQSPCKSLQTN